MLSDDALCEIFGPGPQAYSSGVCDLPDFLARLLVPEPTSGCWLYAGTRESRNGYGRVWWEGREQQVHILTYKFFRGLYAAGLILDHLCRVRACANPWHLEPVTHKTNTDRGLGRLRQFRRAEEYAV